MAKRATLVERLRYEFDKSMAAGPIALVGWLTVLLIAVSVLVTAFLMVTQIKPDDATSFGFVEAFWTTLMRALDTGNVGGDNGWPFRIVSLAVTLFGIMVFSGLIGVLAAGISGRLAELRRGRSRVLETGHTVIFNWSPSIVDVIAQMIVANANVARACIVVMAAKDKVEMEDEIAAKLGKTANTRIVCRSGDPTDLYDLPIASPHTAKSVIVLSPESDNADSQVIKTILALVHDPKRGRQKLRIAAELRDTKNAELARVVGGAEVQPVLADDLISRIIVHSSRQAGLSAVYSELLDFEGCEIYTSARPELNGMRFGDALARYDTSTLIGLKDAEGRVRLNPPMDAIIGGGAQAIVIAEDDNTIVPDGRDGNVDASAIREAISPAEKPLRTLILGWNRRGPMIAAELAKDAVAGSQLFVVADTQSLDREIGSLVHPGPNLTFEHRIAHIGDRAVLESLDVPSYDRVIVLGYTDTMPALAADTHTLITLLHIRKIIEQSGKPVSVISEISDVRNRELAEVTHADDFVVSNTLVSYMLAQVSENSDLGPIFAELLDAEGAEIFMRPVADYVTLDRPVNFYTVAEAARRRGETALGYRRQREGDADARHMGGVTINPKKSDAVAFGPGDRIVVLAHD